MVLFWKSPDNSINIWETPLPAKKVFKSYSRLPIEWMYRRRELGVGAVILNRGRHELAYEDIVDCGHRSWRE